MKALQVETKNGVEIITGVQEWGWQAVTGDLYYRRDGKLYYVKCKSVKVLSVKVNTGR